MKLKPCGTTAAYFRHIRAGEETCQPCRDAMTNQRKRYGRSKRERAWTIQDELVDWLSVEGTWATAFEAAERFGRNVDSVERALRKLRGKGLVESRTVDLARVADGGYERRTEWRVS